MKCHRVVLCSALFSSAFCFAQDLQAHVQTMKNSYASSGNIVVLDDHTLVIEPSMPSPLCALPKVDGDKTSWSYYTFPLASITVPLAAIDETLIGEDQVYTNPEAARAFRPGDHGDTTMVVIVGEPGETVSRA